MRGMEVDELVERAEQILEVGGSAIEVRFVIAQLLEVVRGDKNE